MQEYNFSLLQQCLDNNWSIIFPTETVYGLWCNAMSDVAINNLLKLTYRPQEKWITTLCDSIDMIQQYAHIRYETELKIINHFMPWPLTMILESKHILSPLLEQANGTVWVRIPDHEIPLNIIRQYGNGLATKSANITWKTPPISFDMIDPYFENNNIPMVDGGICPLRISSTIIRVVTENEFIVLREGSISADDIKTILL